VAPLCGANAPSARNVPTPKRPKFTAICRLPAQDLLSGRHCTAQVLRDPVEGVKPFFGFRLSPGVDTTIPCASPLVPIIDASAGEAATGHCPA
jgi:hypothetical protein